MSQSPDLAGYDIVYLSAITRSAHKIAARVIAHPGAIMVDPALLPRAVT